MTGHLNLPLEVEMELCHHLANPFEIVSTLVFWMGAMNVKKGADLMDCLKEIDDPRKLSNGMLHDFQDLVMLVTDILCGCDAAEEIAAWAKARGTWLRR